METALRTHLRKILRAIAATNAEDADAIRKVEAQGRRIVAGGGLGDGRWDITDWRTGERLASGTGGYEEYGAASDRLDPDGRWIHIDKVNEEVDWDGYDIAPTDGIPASLSSALVDWAEHGNTPVEEIAQVAAWTTEEVERCLAKER